MRNIYVNLLFYFYERNVHFTVASCLISRIFIIKLLYIFFIGQFSCACSSSMLPVTIIKSNEFNVWIHRVQTHRQTPLSYACTCIHIKYIYIPLLFCQFSVFFFDCKKKKRKNVIKLMKIFSNKLTLVHTRIYIHNKKNEMCTLESLINLFTPACAHTLKYSYTHTYTRLHLLLIIIPALKSVTLSLH